MTGNLALISALNALRQLDVAPTSLSNLDGYQTIVQALGRRDSDAARRASCFTASARTSSTVRSRSRSAE